MTTTNTTTATDLNDVSMCSGVITASDFSDRVTDTTRHDWTEGKIRHVIAALKDRRVAIVTDKRTGHTLFNVRLVRVIPGGGGDYARVQVEYVYAPGKSKLTNYLIFNVGPVITLMPAPVTDKRDKWAALDTWREERSAAITVAHDLRVAQGLSGDGVKSFGRLDVRPTAYGCVVSFDADRDRAKREGVDMFAPAQRFWHTTVTPAQIEAELDRRANVAAHYAAAHERTAAGVPDTCEV